MWSLNQIPIVQSKNEEKPPISFPEFWNIELSEWVWGRRGGGCQLRLLTWSFSSCLHKRIWSQLFRWQAKQLFCCCFYAEFLGGLFFDEYCSLIFKKGILPLALLRGSICVMAMFTMIKMGWQFYIQVCRHWRHVGESPSLWKKATIILRSNDNIKEVVVMVMKVMIVLIWY